VEPNQVTLAPISMPQVGSLNPSASYFGEVTGASPRAQIIRSSVPDLLQNRPPQVSSFLQLGAHLPKQVVSIVPFIPPGRPLTSLPDELALLSRTLDPSHKSIFFGCSLSPT